MGGLGNQLFQASHALAQAWRAQVEPIFRPVSFTPLQGQGPHNYKSNIFKKLKFTDFLNSHKRVHEGPWHYTEINPTWDKSIEFVGYFQSSKNFLGYDDKIKEIFSPDKDFIDYAFAKYPQLNLPNTTSIHARFGDYKNSPNVHPVISESYLMKALEEIGDIDHLFLFSDDKNFNLKEFDQTKITVVDEDDYKELWLMSLCKNNIISNSTFSWWGAFLNKNSEKKIIAPSIWFGPEGAPIYKDIYEPYWKIINVEIKKGELIYVA